jgi:hypothetical protein
MMDENSRLGDKAAALVQVTVTVQGGTVKSRKRLFVLGLAGATRFRTN